MVASIFCMSTALLAGAPLSTTAQCAGGYAPAFVRHDAWGSARYKCSAGVRARGMPARQPARQPAARARWLLNARPVAKTDARIVFLSEFWV